MRRKWMRVTTFMFCDMLKTAKRLGMVKLSDRRKSCKYMFPDNEENE
jgi:hypothetical protein